jgi:glycosyltransferase involved in cell wall biosynthesis
VNLLILSSTFPTSDSDPLGGFVLDFCLKLSESHKVTVLTQKRAEAYTVDKRINLITFSWSGDKQPLSDLKFTNPFHLFHILSLFRNAHKALKKISAGEKIDHCFALWAIPSGIGARYLLRKKKIPYDIWCLGSDIWKHKDNFFTSWLLHKILSDAKQVYGDGLKFCEEIEAFSGRDCKFLPSCRVIPRNLFTEADSTKKTFTFIGRYHYVKGPDVLINAISLLPKEVSRNTGFVFYGPGNFKQKCMELAQNLNLNNVFFNDVVDKEHIYEVIVKSHFLIIPSRFDSIPVVLSDSLQGNTPVIVANIGDLGDITQKYQLGYVFEKENAKELSDCIVKAFDDDKAKYLSAIQEAMKIFSVEKSVEAFCKNIVVKPKSHEII